MNGGHINHVEQEGASRMAAGVAHDLNNFLAAILATVESLRSADSDTSMNRALLLNDIEEAARSSCDLVQRLLASSHSSAEQQDVDLDSLIQSSTGFIQRLVGDGVHFVCRTGAPGMKVKGNRSQLQRVLLNLVVNAREAMAGSGILEVETRPVVAGGKVFVQLLVRDNGVGMDVVTKALIFEPYFSTKAEGGGLGLATIAEIVASYGGTIEVDSSPGRGTTFRIRLPHSGLPASKPAATGRSAASISMLRPETGHLVFEL